jgi:flagellar hook-associated protein 2
MSDIYIPGINSRFNSGKIIEDLMKVERIPKNRVEQSIDSLENRKIWWQDLGKRISSLRESSRTLFSFQNPFNERVAVSSDENVISATATREASEREYTFKVKQLAQADRFLSSPLDEKTAIEAGTYSFTAGKEEVSLDFRGGSLKDFADALTRRGRNIISASLITVQPGTRSLLLESKLTGTENRLGFSGSAEALAAKLGLAEQADDSRREIAITADTVRENTLPGLEASGPVTVQDSVLELPSLTSVTIPFNLYVEPGSPLALKVESATTIKEEIPQPIPQPPPGPGIVPSGSFSYEGMTIENSPSTTPLPEWNPPQPPLRLDNLNVFSLSFSDGSKVALPSITDTENFNAWQYNLSDIAGGKTITALNIDNVNTHRDISVQGAMIFDPNATGGYKPLRPVSTAQDAIVVMEGIEMIRPSNTINDIIPGVTITARSASERPVRLEVQADHEGVKNAIFAMVGNYNRLIAEVNVLTARSLASGTSTRVDDSIIDELTYLSADEIAEMRKRLGAFSGDSTLTNFKSNLMRAVSAPYPTDAERDLAMLAQIGISTNVQGGGSYNVSQMRGYLQIDEKVLDTAMERYLPAIKQLFGSDSDGDLLPDTGIAYNLEALSRPFVETGGIISLKTGTLDSRIGEDRRRIDTMERQLAAKEADLKAQYSRMESAYARMEQMSSSLDNFSQRNNNNR